jgi:signal transduction histidine kinase/ligand-binding sensor domain-containing protein
MRLPFPALLLACLLLSSPLSALGRASDEVPLSDDYVLRVWNLSDGLGDNHIGSINRDDAGYLWLTTLAGLFRFDGARMVNADDDHAPGLGGYLPSLALVAKDGSLWVAMDRGGVGRLRDGQLRMVLPVKPRSGAGDISSDLAEGADGAVWIGENDEARVTRINGDDEAVVYGVAEGLPAGRETRIRTAANGTVWVATTGGCAVFDGRRFHAVDPEAGGARRPVLARSRYGGMWASRGGRLIKYDDEGNRLESLGPAWFQDVSQVNALLEDGSGALWIGTLDSGLFCYKGGGFQRVPTSFSDIYCLMEDGEGNVWCGTWGGGLNRISPRRFFMRQVRHGAPGEVVRSMLEDTEKRFWAVGRYGRLVRSAGPEVGSFLPVPLPGTDLRVTTLAPSGPGIWVGTNQGLLRWDKELQSETLVREPVAALLAERNGTVWAGTETGPLLRCTGEKVDSIDSVRSARAMALDQRGRLWVGTEQGQLFTQHGDRFEAVSIPDTQPNRTVRFILPDENDTLWIGVLQGGLYQYRNGRIRKVPDAPKGALRELRCLLIERGAPPATDKPPRSSPDDVFWIGTANGLLRTTRSAIEAALETGSRKRELLVIGPNEGVPDAEFSMGFQNGAIQASDGRLLFGTNLGVLEAPANALPRRRPAGRVLIEEAVSGDLAFHAPARGAWVIPPNPDVIRIRYTLPELSTPEQVRFRYRLDSGAKDGRWIEVGRQREITVVQPAPGTFRFEVTAAVGDGPWLGPPATADFIVRATWWQTAAFRWGLALSIIGLLAALTRGVEMQRIRTRIRRLEHEHAIERERARIARDMHDEVGANLTHIATTTRLAALDSPSATGDHLKEIEAAARHTVESLDEIVWAVNPRNDTLPKTVEYVCKFAAGFLSKTGVRPEIVAPDAIPDRRISAEARHHLFLAVKEAVNNIAKHSGARSARMEVIASRARLRVVIEDDGRGFEAGHADKFSNGLINMRDRLNAVGGGCAIESLPAIRGCRVTFELPLTSP